MSMTESVIIKKMSYIFAANGLDDIVRWCTQKLRDDGELINVIFAGEQGLSFKHLREYASCAPYINFHVVFLPCKHNLRGTIVSSRNIARHLRVLNTGETKVANFQVTVLVHKDVAGLQVAVDDSCRMYVLQSSLEFYQCLESRA